MVVVFEGDREDVVLAGELRRCARILHGVLGQLG
jgi:hypothetical protein